MVHTCTPTTSLENYNMPMRGNMHSCFILITVWSFAVRTEAGWGPAQTDKMIKGKVKCVKFALTILINPCAGFWHLSQTQSSISETGRPAQRFTVSMVAYLMQHNFHIFNTGCFWSEYSLIKLQECKRHKLFELRDPDRDMWQQVQVFYVIFSEHVRTLSQRNAAFSLLLLLIDHIV